MAKAWKKTQENTVETNPVGGVADEMELNSQNQEVSPEEHTNEEMT